MASPASRANQCDDACQQVWPQLPQVPDWVVHPDCPSVGSWSSVLGALMWRSLRSFARKYCLRGPDATQRPGSGLCP